ncbi:MAG: phosphatidylglycerophosphatase A [candidate division Zixibacteria bacterium]|nr:phosphatidylglycerophosphatase A [candidate division Zixibacteria bacterium]
MKRIAIKMIASGFYSGYSPLIPGTTGTIPAWLIAYYLIAGNLSVLIAATVVTTALSIWVAGEAESYYGHDSKKIVMDEWAGMFIAIILVPFSLTNYAIAFVAFRIFDVIKLPPAAQAERLPRGWGVTMDDVVAGIQANIATRVVIFAMGYFGV